MTRQANGVKLLNRLQEAMTSYSKGYRSNALLDEVRPHFHEKQRWFLSMDHREVMYGGAAGGGKVLYDTGKILTPFGFRTGSDLRVGDLVNNPDGSICRIIQLHPRQAYQIWRVTFHDGAFTDVAEQHLWLAWRSGKRKKVVNTSTFGQSAAEVIETRELKSWCDAAKSEQSRGVRPHWPCIPTCKPQRFNTSRRYKCELDPYLLGVWLGDGHCADKGLQIGFTTDDIKHFSESLEANEADFGVGDKIGTSAKKLYFRGKYKNWWVNQLSRVGLWLKKSKTKFVPSEIKQGPIETRTAVLQGLLDTDGTVDERGQIYYTTISKKLADDVQFIVQSLGGTATIFTKTGSYRDEDWNLIECNLVYNLYIKLPDETIAFRLPRKKNRCQSGGSLMYRRVVDVQILSQKKTGRCITVSHPNGLYITNDFIVTHNSDALLAAALQYIDVPGYAALILRRTYADLSKSGALLDRASQLLAGTVMKKHDGGKKWTHPGGGKLEFGFMDSDGDKYKYQSSEYQFCVHIGTPVLMADSSYKRIIDINVGDFVQTLQGPRRVSRVHRPRLNACVRVSSSRGEQVQSVQHRLLTARGSWASYLSMCGEARLSAISLPKQFHTAGTLSSRTETISQTVSRIPSQRLSHPPLPYEPFPQRLDRPNDLVSSVFGAENRNDVSAYCDARSTSLLPQSSFALSTLRRPSPTLTVCLGLLNDGASCVRSNPLSQGCKHRYSACSRPYGEPPRPALETVQCGVPQPTDAEALSSSSHNEDGLGRTLERIPERLETYNHPYTTDTKNSFLDVRPSPCVFTPVGFDWTMDITVEDASHYITASGLIQANCGWDELTQIPEEYYTYLFSRLRKPAKHCPDCFKTILDAETLKPKPSCKLCYGTGINPLYLVPIRCRAGTNPGGVHGEWVKRNFIPKGYLLADEETQFSHVWSKQGICILCAGRKQIEIRSALIDCPSCDGSGYSQRFFVPARLEDNESVDAVSYEVNLAHLDPVERAGLRHGRWDFMSDGLLFQRSWMRQYGWRGDHIELYNPEGKRLLEKGSYITFITADTASKIKTTNDYTCLCVWALCVKTAALCLLEVFRKRVLTPEILPEILRLREKWHCSFAVVEEASSGITIIQEVQHTARGRGLTVLPYSPHTGDKVARSHEAQIRMQNGQIYFPDTRDETIAECINEMLLFFTPDAHDDFVDNLTMAAWYASGQWRNKSIGSPGQTVRRGLKAPITRFRGY